MAFNVKIGVIGDGAAKKQIADIGTELEKVERKGERFWQSASRSYRRQAEETARLKQETGGLIQQLTQISTLRFDGALGGIGGLKAGILGLGAAAVGLIASIGDIHRGLMTAGDEMIRLRNRIGTIMPNQGQAAFAMQDTKSIANRAMTDWAPTNELYVRLTNATKELGLHQVEVLKLTESISKGFQLQGATAQEASAGMIQLSQAFASGRLQGDEFRSLSESMPFILDLVANRMGVTRSELKKLSSDGKITAKVLVDAFADGADQIDASFARIEKTFDQRMKPLQNEAIEDPTKMFSHDLYGVKNFLDLSADERSQTPLGRLAEAFTPMGGAAEVQRDLLQKQNAELAQTEVLMKQLALQTEQTRIRFQGLLEIQDELSSKKDPWFIKPPPEMKTTVDILREQINGLRALGDPDIGTRVQLMVGQLTQEFLTWGDAAKSVLSSATSWFTDALPPSVMTSVIAFQELLSSINDVDGALSGMDSAVHAPSGIVNHALGVAADLLRGQKGAWGSMTDEEIRANMAKRHGGGRRAKPREVDNIWNDGVIMNALFGQASIGADGVATGENFSSLFSSVVDDAKRQLQGLHAWEQAAASEDNFFTRMISSGRQLIEEAEKNNQRLTDSWKRTLAALNEKPTIGLGIEQSLRELVAGFETAGQVIKKAMTTALEGIEDSIIHLVDTGKLELGDLAKELRNLFIRSAIRGTAAQFLPSLPIPGGGGGSGGGAGGGGSSARVAPISPTSPTFHIVFDEGMQHASAVSPRGQANTVNVVYKTHGAYLAVKDRLRSRS